MNKKLPPRRIPTVGIVQKVPSTTNTTIYTITTMAEPFAPPMTWGPTTWGLWIRLI